MFLYEAAKTPVEKEVTIEQRVHCENCSDYLWRTLYRNPFPSRDVVAQGVDIRHSHVQDLHDYHVHQPVHQLHLSHGHVGGSLRRRHHTAGVEEGGGAKILFLSLSLSLKSKEE